MTEEPKGGQPGRACSEGPVGRESQTRKVQIKERAPWTRLKLVPSGLDRPVKQKGLPHAC